MKFFMSMLGFLMLIALAFYVGYSADLAPVEGDDSAAAYGYGAVEERPQGGIRTGGGAQESTGFGGLQGGRPTGAPAPQKRCLENARC